MGWIIFCLVPSALIGLAFGLVAKPLGWIVFLGLLAFTSDIGRPRLERGER